MTPITWAAILLASVVVGAVALLLTTPRATHKPDVRFDPKDPAFHRMVRDIERRDSGGHGRID